MSKATDYVEKVRESWGISNDGDGSGLDADLIDGLEKNELPISDAAEARFTTIETDVSNRTIGSWTFDPATGTLSITGVPEV